MSGLYKAEVTRKDGSWRGLDDVERAALTWWIGLITADCYDPLAMCRRLSLR